MDKLVCDLCGWKSNQKRFKFEDINKHFENAKYVWCPRNCCKEQFERIISKGYVCNWWYDYGGWYTVEERPKIISMDTVRAIQRARQIRDIGMQMLNERNK